MSPHLSESITAPDLRSIPPMELWAAHNIVKASGLYDPPPQQPITPQQPTPLQQSITPQQLIPPQRSILPQQFILLQEHPGSPIPVLVEPREIPETIQALPLFGRFPITPTILTNYTRKQLSRFPPFLPFGNTAVSSCLLSSLSLVLVGPRRLRVLSA
jgi:hypothetical protein